MPYPLLAPQLEASLRRSLIYSHGSYAVFFESPLARRVLALAALMVLSPLARRVLARRFWQIVGPVPKAE